jgi:hypothetical protein
MNINPRDLGKGLRWLVTDGKKVMGIVIPMLATAIYLLTGQQVDIGKAESNATSFIDEFMAGFEGVESSEPYRNSTTYVTDDGVEVTKLIFADDNRTLVDDRN